MQVQQTETPETQARQAWLSLLAKAPSGEARALLAKTGLSPAFEWLRQPEIGSVMLRGRISGTGAPFNMGEMTVTRCALKLASGEVGHGYVQGRSKDDAQAAAMLDAMLQTDKADMLKDTVLNPLENSMTDQKAARARKAAATKVDFFTMARGED